MRWVGVFVEETLLYNESTGKQQTQKEEQSSSSHDDASGNDDLAQQSQYFAVNIEFVALKETTVERLCFRLRSKQNITPPQSIFLINYLQSGL